MIRTTKKLIDLSQYCDRVEFVVASLLNMHPHANIVKVLSVSTHSIEYEKIESNHGSVVWNDVKDAIDHLHTLGVVYINFTKDSFALKDGKIILKDFGSCGIIATCKSWKLPPVKSTIYNELRKRYVNRQDLHAYDKIAFDYYATTQKKDHQYGCGQALWKIFTLSHYPSKM